MKSLLPIIFAIYSMNVSAEWESFITTDHLTDKTVNVLAFSTSNNLTGGIEISHMIDDKTLNNIITISKNGQKYLANQTLYVRIQVDGNKIIERIGVVTNSDSEYFKINIDQVYSDSNISLFNAIINEMKIGSRMTIGIGEEIYTFSLKGSSKALGTVMATI